MDKIKKIFSSSNFAEWALILTMIFAGGFHEYVSCAASAVISVLLIIKIHKNGKFSFRLNSASIMLGVMLLGYLITTFYAVDKGLAFIGFLKFLPVPLFYLLFSQDSGKREKLISELPLISLVFGAASLILMYIPFASNYFSVAGRLAGTFQYPNSFAMFLTAGLLVSLSAEKLRARNIITAVLLGAFLIFTGSRAVTVIALLGALCVMFFRKGRAVKFITGGIALLGAAAAVIIFFVIGTENLPRFLSFSVNESTFAGRLLYMTDALPLAASHPFGLGYLGYFSMHQSIQTGVYSVRFVHNDLLQAALDLGYIPCAAMIFAFIRPLFDKTKPVSHKIILLAFFAHSIFDFDLQFPAVFFALLLFMDGSFGREITLEKIMPISFVSGVLGALSVYFAIALGLSYFGLYEAADSMYPANTENTAQLLIAQNNPHDQNKFADRIISQNEYIPIAYSAKAHYAVSEGDIENLIKYKRKLFEVAPFDYDEYEEYCYLLIQSESLYSQAGDKESAAYCREELKKTVKKVQSLEGRLSYFGKIIDDRPKTELPGDILKYAQSTEVSNEN